MSALSDLSFYRASSAGERYPRLQGGQRCRVAIIGGGFAGMASALSLAERGETDVCVLEAQQIGHGASGLNGGFVFGGYSLGERALLAQAGPEKGRALYQLTLEAVELIRRRIARYAIDCDKVESGILLANWFDDDAILQQQQAFMRDQLGVQWESVSRGQLREQLLSERYFGALFEKNAFHFHPLKYAQGVAAALRGHGVQVYEDSRALHISRSGSGWRVETAQGSVEAEHLLVCCGGYIEKLYPQLARAILPIATYVMATEPLGARLQDAMRTPAAVYDTRFAFDYYRPLPDTRLLWGGRISIMRKSPQQVARLLYGDMLKVYPQLAGVKVEHAWCGLMSYARHKMPQIGNLAPGLWYAMGFGGHGVGPTSAAGEVLARALTGDTQRLQQFAQWGLPWTGAGAGLLAAQLTYWYYELRDWLNE
ncbi:FAD-binding oxidoreductase [Massilia sp. W12]|uniref:NAD(P)/FAD-dependent oxidoreductase n=1 Tax=Massilia sp. W12 TaxID=3126507 RepID=UPI0030D1EDB3